MQGIDLLFQTAERHARAGGNAIYSNRDARLRTSGMMQKENMRIFF